MSIDRTALFDATAIIAGLLVGSIAGTVTCLIATYFWGF